MSMHLLLPYGYVQNWLKLHLIVLRKCAKYLYTQITRDYLMLKFDTVARYYDRSFGRRAIVHPLIIRTVTDNLKCLPKIRRTVVRVAELNFSNVALIFELQKKVNTTDVFIRRHWVSCHKSFVYVALQIFQRRQEGHLAPKQFQMTQTSIRVLFDRPMNNLLCELYHRLIIPSYGSIS